MRQLELVVITAGGAINIHHTMSTAILMWRLHRAGGRTRGSLDSWAAAVTVLDGKAVALRARQEVKAWARAFAEKFSRPPGLAVVQVGADPASSLYVRSKRRACAEVGIESFAHDLEKDVGEANLLALIDHLNRDERVDGILVQLPLPIAIDANRVMDQVDPLKDVDGFHPENMGLLAQKRPGLRPCTPLGVIRLAEAYGIGFTGRRATVVGASNIVGRPMALELLLAGATVTVCHSRSRDLQAEIERAEIVIAAVGKTGFIPGDWIQPGATVFDVGINRCPRGTLTGDVDYVSASQRASWITPVPGGVGPMTIAMLVSNTVEAAFRRAGSTHGEPAARVWRRP